MTQQHSKIKTQLSEKAMNKKKHEKTQKEVSVVQIGKHGISNVLLTELNEQLKKKKIVKVRILKNAPFKDRSEAFSTLQKKLQSADLVNIRGWTAVVIEKK